MSETRKLAAILVSDVAGYSRLAGADEERTLARLRALRSDLIDPTIALYHGRIVKRTRDRTIVEFRSVVDAVRLAIEVQGAMVDRNAGVSPTSASSFASAFISATWSRRATAILWATGLASRQGPKRRSRRSRGSWSTGEPLRSPSPTGRIQHRRVAVKSFPSKTVRKNYQRIEAQKQPFSELLVVSQFDN
jgi:hypothetical protein